MSVFAVELKKIISNRIFIVVLCTLLLVDVYKVTNLIRTFSKADINAEYKRIEKAYDDMYNYLEGPLKQEKVNEVLSKYNELKEIVQSGSFSKEFDDNTITGYMFSDYNLYKDTYNKILYLIKYKEFSDGIEDRARNNQEYFENTDAYQYKYYTEMENAYKNRNLNTYFRTERWVKCLSYSFSGLITMLLIVFAGYQVFSNERNEQMSVLIITSREGKGKNFAGKVCASLVVSVAIVVVQTLIEWLMFFVSGNLTQLSAPLYAIPEFQYTFFRGSIAEYIIFMVLCRIAAAVIVNGVTLLASSLSSNNLMSLSFSAFFCVMFVVFNEREMPFNVVQLLNISGEAKKFHMVNVCGIPVNYIFYSLFSGLLLYALTLLLCFILEVKHRKLTGKERV